MLPVDPCHHLSVILTPYLQTSIISRWNRFDDLLGRNESSRWVCHFGGLRPGVQDIHDFSLIAQNFRADLFAHSFGINASKPKRLSIEDDGLLFNRHEWR